MNHTLRSFAAVALLVAGMTGCAGLGGVAKKDSSSLDPKVEVAALASARWDALIAGDLAKAYEYLSPGTRSTMSLEVYKAKIRTGSWKKATVDSVSCEMEICKVTMVIEHSYKSLKSIETPLFEDWLQESGRWWFVPRK